MLLRRAHAVSTMLFENCLPKSRFESSKWLRAMSSSLAARKAKVSGFARAQGNSGILGQLQQLRASKVLLKHSAVHFWPKIEHRLLAQKSSTGPTCLSCTASGRRIGQGRLGRVDRCQCFSWSVETGNPILRSPCPQNPWQIARLSRPTKP